MDLLQHALLLGKIPESTRNVNLSSSDCDSNDASEVKLEDNKPRTRGCKRQSPSDDQPTDPGLVDLSSAAAAQRRRMRNKESAAESRQRKKAYVSTLEIEIEQLTKRCQLLESSNHHLVETVYELEKKNSTLVSLLERVCVPSPSSPCCSASGDETVPAQTSIKA